MKDSRLKVARQFPNVCMICGCEVTDGVDVCRSCFSDMVPESDEQSRCFGYFWAALRIEGECKNCKRSDIT